jgi:hypothetical protein
VGEPVRTLPSQFSGQPPGDVNEVSVFCPGCLVVQSGSFASDPGAAARLARAPAFAEWPLLVLVDDARATARSSINFLWTAFTRFEPAADVYAAGVTLQRLHPAFTPPVVLDARRKRGLPEELFCDETTATRVTRRWTEYFPDRRVEMGDSALASLDGPPSEAPAASPALGPRT